tara:strand:+ start:1617 stop:1844 length:228 start_codon:yes stop_codon:yes gene_type:complete
MDYVLTDTDCRCGQVHDVMTFDTPEEASSYRDDLYEALESETDQTTIWNINEYIRQLDSQLYDYDERLSIVEFDS